MSNALIPSRVKSLSLAISQTIILSGGLTAISANAQAVSCTQTVAGGGSLSITSDLTGNVCQTSPGAATITVQGSTIDAGGSTYGVSIESGSITLSGGSSITTSGSDYSEAIVSDGEGDLEILIDAGSSIDIDAESADSYSEATGIYADQGSDVTVTLNADSSVNVQAAAYYDGTATGIIIEADQMYVKGGSSATSSVAGQSTTINVSSTSSDQDADSAGLGVVASSADHASTTSVELTSSAVTISAESASDDASALGVYSEAHSSGSSDGPATASVTLNSTDFSVSADAADDAYAEGIVVNAYGETAVIDPTNASVTLNEGAFTVSSEGLDDADSVGINAQTSDRGTFGEPETTVSLTDVTVSVSASAGDESSASAIAAGAYGEFGAETDVSISGGSLTLNAQSASTNLNEEISSYGEGIVAGSYANAGGAETHITLNDTELSISATANVNEGYGDAISKSLGVSSSARSGDDDHADSVVTLSNSSLNVSAAAQVADDSYTSEAYAEGIKATAWAADDTASVAVVLNNGASLTVSSQADYAESVGVHASSGSKYGNDDEVSVELDGVSVSVSAAASEDARATAVYAEGSDVDVSIADTTIDVSASSDSGYGVAIGISAHAEQNLNVELNNAVVNVSGAGAGYGEGITSGIQFSNEGYGAAVTLNGTSITVSNSGEGPSVGIWETNFYAKGGSNEVTITLDSASRIDADYAVVAMSEYASLDNAGVIDGTVFVRNIDNSGSINGFVQADRVQTTGTITGNVNATELDVLSGGVVAGSANVGTLNVAAGGELQAIMTDEIDPEIAHFTAHEATLEDGARVRINGTSELFNPDLEGVTYLIAEAQTSLTADIEALLLSTSGLIGAEWAECGALSLCVNVRALDLEELAELDDASVNGVDAAIGAQSVLEQLSGSETADRFMEVIERVVDQGAWEELDGSGQGESLLASKDSDRVVSRYVQRLLQQGRSSGEEFESARGLWVQALQSDGDGDSDNGVAGFDVDTTGIAIGFDSELKPGLIVGGVVSSTDTEVDSDDNSSSVDTDTVMASVYGQWTQGPLFANMVMTYGQSDNDSNRYIVGELASADYDSDFISLRMQAGKAFGFESGIVLRPRVELAYSKVDIDSYDEKGSVAALSIGSQSYETAELGAGIEVSKAFIIDKGVWTPYVDFAVYHDFADDQIRNSSRFLIGGDSFVTAGNDAEQTNISATMGVGYGVGAHHAFKAAYEYFGNSDYDSATWMLRYSYSF
ncbi:MAG: autotransporter domain-containing protein [Cellvibrionaceae bacterium]